MFKYNKQPQSDYPSELFDAIRKFLDFNSLEWEYITTFRKMLSKAMYIDEMVRSMLNKDFDRRPFQRKLIHAYFEDNLVKEGSEADRIDTLFGEQLANIILNDKEFKISLKEKPDENNLNEKLVGIAFKNKLLDGIFEQKLLNILLKNKPDRDKFIKLVEYKYKEKIVESITTNIYSKKDILKVYEIIKLHDTEKDRLEIEKLTFNKPLIVPLGLHSAVLHFEAHFAVSGDNPIMILGQTGVGKSMFLYLAKRLFKKQHRYDSIPPPIVEANCAHFTGSGSGYSLARSELFGHVEGAFTDAHKDKTGLVEKANGGLLILEEVGELPKEVQAMLLTFIETGEYRKLGGEKLETATAKVVAATNRESALRDDFRYRFFPYYIPPLRERKNDILYYFHEIFPELTKNFTKSEVLMLLTHHWPGNVREIERIGRLLNRERWINEQIHQSDRDNQESLPEDRLSHLDPRDTSFDPTILEKFVEDLGYWDVDVLFLEKLLQKHRVSVDDDANQKAFEELSSKNSGWFSAFDEYTLRFCEEYSPFNEAYEGYLLFCDLFLQDPAKENNILATIKSQCTISEFNNMRNRFDDKPSYQRPMKILRKKIMKYLMEVDGADYDHIDNPWELWSILEQDQDESKKDYFDFEFGSEKLQNAIADIKELDLLRLYYQKQLDKTGGNIKAAAKRIGMNENTFRNRLKKLKMRN